MIKAKSTNGVVNFERSITIKAEQAEKIKANPRRIKKVLKDLCIEHELRKEDNVFISTISCSFESVEDVIEKATELTCKHAQFISYVDELPGREPECPSHEDVDGTGDSYRDDEKEDLNVADKYMSELKDIKERACKDGIGLCALIVDGKTDEFNYLGFVPKEMCALFLIN